MQTLTLDRDDSTVSFAIGSAPIFGLGEGGPQFDRRGTVYPSRNGQGGYQLRTHGGRVPIQWLVSPDGWGLYIHQPLGSFDLIGSLGRLMPDERRVAARRLRRRRRTIRKRSSASTRASPATRSCRRSGRSATCSRIARSTGPDEINWVARTFREKKLPCDALIYLGTEFTPSGWNTRNGEFGWKPENFPDPKKFIDDMHAQHYKVVLHVVIEGQRMSGAVADPCTPDQAVPSGRTPDDRWPADRAVPCYWPYHKPLYDLGVDGMWPDQGDGLDEPSRLARIRMYWEGPAAVSSERAAVRAASQRLAGHAALRRVPVVGRRLFVLGDAEDARAGRDQHRPVGHSVLGHRHRRLRADGGLHRRAARALVPVRHVLSVVPIARAQLAPAPAVGLEHGEDRPVGAARLHRRRGRSRSEGAEQPAGRADREEVSRAALSAAAVHLHDRARVLRHRPADDARALAASSRRCRARSRRGDQFLWGRDILVSPVVEKGATSRRLYLPRGRWFDFWTEQGLDGGREIDRAVDLETMPLHVRAGAIIPMGPVKQYTDEPVDAPLDVTVYPGADGAFTLYEDDGKTLRAQGRRLRCGWR